MKFIDFSSIKNKNVLELLLALTIIVIVFVISLFWSIKPEVYARDFLPQSTVFYYESVDVENFGSQNNYNLFDYNVAKAQLDIVANILSKYLVEPENFIWFKVENSEENSYLVRLSSYPNNLVENLRSNHPEFYYNRLNKNILLISESENIANNPAKQVVAKFNTNYTDKGTNIYFDLRYTPEFLQKISASLERIVDSSDIFINLSDNNINFYKINQPQATNLASGQPDLYNYARQPENFDFAIGTGHKSALNSEEFITKDILLPIFNSLPYHNLNFDDLKQYFLEESIVWQREDSWLIAKNIDWQPLAGQFAKTFEIQEKKKLLPDGTLYIEYVSSGSPTITNHQYKEQSYWQIDSLYGWQADTVYYLANNEDMIKEIIDKNRPMSETLSNCSRDKNYFLSDFIILNTDKLPEGDFKTYLSSKNIKKLNMFGYFNYVSTGVLLCQ